MIRHHRYKGPGHSTGKPLRPTDTFKNLDESQGNSILEEEDNGYLETTYNSEDYSFSY